MGVTIMQMRDNRNFPYSTSTSYGPPSPNAASLTLKLQLHNNLEEDERCPAVYSVQHNHIIIMTMLAV